MLKEASFHLWVQYSLDLPLSVINLVFVASDEEYMDMCNVSEERRKIIRKKTTPHCRIHPLAAEHGNLFFSLLRSYLYSFIDNFDLICGHILVFSLLLGSQVSWQ